MSRTVICAAVALLTWFHCGDGLKILGVFPMASHSHYTIGFRVMKELADRGHEVTFVSAFPQKNPVKNLKDISLAGFNKLMEKFKVNLFDIENRSPFLSMPFYYLMGNAVTKFTFASDEMQELLKSDAQFDVIVNEEFLAPSLMGLAHRFKAPLVFLCAMGANQWHNGLFGNPEPASFVPSVVTSHSSRMNFFERLHNLMIYTFDDIYRHLVYYPAEDDILHRYLPDAPPLSQIMYNASLILLNSHTSYKDPVPLLPNMIEIGGYHVSPPKPLPKHLKDYLDDAPNGVVYFSMGSNLKSADMPVEKRNAILRVLSRLKQKVLWKFETDEIGTLPENVKIEKWLPQQDILAHPNVKAFISHGGLLSTIETIYHAVPILGIPIFGDQKMNMAVAVEKGYAVSLPYGELAEKTFERALREILDNPKYAQNVKLRSKLLHDRPRKPLDEAVYWIEYVARNGRCEHFRSSALDLAWYQRSMLDIAIFLVAIAAVLLLGFSYTIKKLLGPKPKKKKE